MHKITLTNTSDVYAMVDIEDCDRVNQYKWYLLITEDGNRYIRCSSSGQVGLLHRFLLGYPTEYVDHINGDGTDNRRENLRISNNKLNQANSRKHKPGKSKYKGVCSKRNKWRAYICPDRKYISLGVFNTEKEAAEAYNQAALRFFGEHAYLNQIG